MALSSHVFKRGGVFHFRVRVPSRLRAVVRRRELWRSLRTNDVETARHRGARLAALTGGLWRALTPTMSPDDAKRLVDQWLLAKLEEDADIRDLPPGDEHFMAVFRKTDPWLPDELIKTYDQAQVAGAVNRGDHSIFPKAQEETAHKHVTDRDIVKLGFRKPIERAHEWLVFDEDTVARPLVRAMLKEAGIEVDENTPGFKAAVRFMMRAQKDLWLAHLDRDEAMWRRWSSDDPAEPLKSRLLARDARPTQPTPSSVFKPATTRSDDAVPQHPTGLTIDDAAEAYIAESLSGGVFKPGRAEEVRVAVKTFLGWADRPLTLDSVTQALAGDYRKDMVFYPESASKRPEYRDLPIGERIRKARARGEPRLSSLLRVGRRGKEEPGHSLARPESPG